MGRTTMKTMASANIPAVDAHVSGGHHRPRRRGGRECRLSDLGFSLFMIRDEISGRKSRTNRALTIGMLAGFDILRAGGFDRLKFKVA